LLYVQDGNESFDDNDLLNLEKMILFAKIIGRIHNTKKAAPYAFVKVSFIQNYIQNYEVFTDEELEIKSKLFE